MADMKQIHDFAVKWCDKFRDQNINYIELVDHYMADDCAALGSCSTGGCERWAPGPISEPAHQLLPVVAIGTVALP